MDEPQDVSATEFYLRYLHYRAVCEALEIPYVPYVGWLAYRHRPDPGGFLTSLSIALH